MNETKYFLCTCEFSFYYLDLNWLKLDFRGSGGRGFLSLAALCSVLRPVLLHLSALISLISTSRPAAGPRLKPISLYLNHSELIGLARYETVNSGHDGVDLCQKTLTQVSTVTSHLSLLCS